MGFVKNENYVPLTGLEPVINQISAIPSGAVDSIRANGLQLISERHTAAIRMRELLAALEKRMS